mmetsp:Transcript_26435/g.23229  ORF Transcript_26435/g.23229 Transcript_26435/m.23229 type:complete len:265 (-) Transcript_26435:205-999(-)
MAAKKKKVGFAMMEPKDPNKDANEEEDNTQFQHKHTKTAHALEHAKYVEKGKKFWEEKEQYEHLSELEWWQLKAAKDFETGVGQKFFRHGTLSTWTDQQVAALQKEMQSTLDMAGYNDEDTSVTLKTPKAQVLPGKKVSASNLDDFAAEIKKQQDKQKSKPTASTLKKKKSNTESEESKDPLYDFDDEIIHTGNSDDEDEDGKQSKYGGDSMMQFDPSKLKELTSMDQLAGKFDPTAGGGGGGGAGGDELSDLEARFAALKNGL